MLAKQQTVARVVGLLTRARVDRGARLAMAGTGRQGYALSLFQLLAGAAFLGSIRTGCCWGTGTSPTADCLEDRSTGTRRRC